MNPGKETALNLGSQKYPLPLGQGLPATLTWSSFEKSQWPGHCPKSTTSEPRGRGVPVSAFVKSPCDSLSSGWGEGSLEWAHHPTLITLAPSVSQLVIVG